ncbi:MAG: hypothetical protein SO002_03090, partial [Candidatus Faecousia sp.]|nr:hypothetical protein [Candidatus Faecousia sp.]
ARSLPRRSSRSDTKRNILAEKYNCNQKNDIKRGLGIFAALFCCENEYPGSIKTENPGTFCQTVPSEEQERALPIHEE